MPRLQETLYTGFYTGTDLSLPGRNPLRQERAFGKAAAVWMPPLFLPPVLVTLIPALVFGARIESDPLLRFVPLMGLYWFVRWDLLASYRDPSLHHWINDVFMATFVICALVVLVPIPIAVKRYRLWLRRGDGLPSEHGGARWAMPEDLASPADPKDNLLPDDYDIYRGFGKKSKLTARYFQQQATHLKVEQALTNHELDENEIRL